jgi:hypothetical protein
VDDSVETGDALADQSAAGRSQASKPAARTATYPQYRNQSSGPQTVNKIDIVRVRQVSQSFDDMLVLV